MKEPRENSEVQLRRRRVDQARTLICNILPIEAKDDDSCMLAYNGFYLQISFSALHPLLVLYFARGVDRKITDSVTSQLNDLNLHSIIGSHTINKLMSCYTYRATYWLDTELTRERFIEVLNRSLAEAQRGFGSVAIPA